jgi:hypothetical protein
MNVGGGKLEKERARKKRRFTKRKKKMTLRVKYGCFAI